MYKSNKVEKFTHLPGEIFNPRIHKAHLPRQVLRREFYGSGTPYINDLVLAQLQAARLANIHRVKSNLQSLVVQSNRALWAPANRALAALLSALTGKTESLVRHGWLAPINCDLHDFRLCPAQDSGASRYDNFCHLKALLSALPLQKYRCESTYQVRLRKVNTHLQHFGFADITVEKLKELMPLVEKYYAEAYRAFDLSGKVYTIVHILSFNRRYNDCIDINSLRNLVNKYFSRISEGEEIAIQECFEIIAQPSELPLRKINGMYQHFSSKPTSFFS